MKKNKFILVLLFSLVATLLSGCAMGPRAESTPGLSADATSAYVAFQQFVYKVDLTSGKEIWRYPAQSNVQVVLYAPPLVDEEYLYIGDLANKFHRINLETGLEEWTFAEAKGWYQAKASSDGSQIVVPNSDRNVYSLNLDGSLKWKYSSEYGFLAEPIIVGDVVIISSMDHFIVALNKDTGEVIWKTELAGSLIAAPYYDAESNRLYVGSLGDEFVALDSKSGEVQWTFNADEKLSSIWSTPILIEDNLILTDEAGKIFSLDPNSGEVLWQMETGSDMLAGPVAIDGGFLIISQDGNLRAYDLEQNPLWTRAIAGTVYTTPVISGDTIVVAVTKGDILLQGFDQRGNQIWSFTPEN
ncbi:MAG: PQQ-binding-like beta-propeller repeat protein [Anaerolineaceae bacterium]|jgi:outer membrane protein assembly factor BamB